MWELSVLMSAGCGGDAALCCLSAVDVVVRAHFYKYFHPKEALVSNGVLNRQSTDDYVIARDSIVCCVYCCAMCLSGVGWS